MKGGGQGGGGAAHQRRAVKVLFSAGLNELLMDGCRRAAALSFSSETLGCAPPLLTPVGESELKRACAKSILEQGTVGSVGGGEISPIRSCRWKDSSK